METVDAQVHIWGEDTPERPWPAGRAHHAQKPYAVTAEMVAAEMEVAGIDRVVLVPPSWEGDRNDLALAAAQKYPAKFAVMGRLPLEHPNPDVVATWREQPGMLGMRFTFHLPDQRPWLNDGTAEWLWNAAEEHGIPVMVFVPGGVKELGEAAERHPGLRFTLDHLAMREGMDDEAFAGLSEVLSLARLPNVAVKASALPCYSTEEYPFPGLHQYIRQVYDAFGPQRMFWGTDWTRLPCTWAQAKALFTEELPWLSDDDKQWIMGRGIKEWLGWETD